MEHITIVIPKGEVHLGSVTGCYEILRMANQDWIKHNGKPSKTIRIASLEKSIKLDHGYFTIHPTRLSEVRKTDLILIPPVHYHDKLLNENRELMDWIRKNYKNGAEVATMCSGTFLLAATGLLDGLICSTHWRLAEDFSKLFPNAKLQADKLITSDKGIYTNGGAYSFLNLMLFLVEKYFNRRTAIYCSKVFQIDIDRNLQSPFCIFQAQKNHNDETIKKAQEYIETRIGEKVSIEHLSSILAVGRRNFDRRFIKATGNTPIKYQQRVKIEFAKSELESSRKTVNEIMYEIGYSDVKAFREMFKKITGLSPLAYRERFDNSPIFTKN